MGKHKEKSKKHHKHKKSKKKHSKHEREYSSSNTSSEEEWVEKPSESSQEECARDEWMSLPTNFSSSSHLDRRRDKEESKRQERERQTYNPRENVRELNPYWKDGGDGLPSASRFQKPDESNSRREYVSKSYKSSSNWRKTVKQDERSKNEGQSERATSSSNWRKNLTRDESNKNEDENVPTTSLDSWRKKVTVDEKIESEITTNRPSEKDLNVLAAKLVKAEIMGNTKLVVELKEKLEKARASQAGNETNDDVLLTRTDSKGYSRPVELTGESSGGGKNKKRKVETHAGGERVRYFADDDKYNLKQMFENEKFSSVEEENRQFMQLAGRISKNDDLDDVFADKIRRKDTDSKMEQRNKDRAIQEHKRTTESLDNCRLCLQSRDMPKHLMISMSENFYLSLPPQEPLTDGHCVLIPTRHVPCGTQLDENEWDDLMNFRKALVKMFAAADEDVIFFETAVHLNRFPHMSVTCVPLPREQGDLAPIYFKKAIDESETEWASNKKLISLKDRDVRRAVPKGLPYFCVSFGLQEGYAHVVEDYQLFPNNFAEEIIGGMLDLHHSKWRKPKRQSFDEQSRRVMEFSKKWKDFDFTIK